MNKKVSKQTTLTTLEGRIDDLERITKQGLDEMRQEFPKVRNECVKDLYILRKHPS